MKRLLQLTIIALLLSGEILTAQTAKSEKLTLKASVQTVEDFVVQVERHSHVKFVCDRDNLEMLSKVKVPAVTATAGEIINTVFKDTDIVATFAGDYVVLTPKFRENAYLGLGGKKFSGKVSDEFGEPLPGAAVVLEGSTRAVVTDADGNFSLNLFPGSKLVTVSFLGQETSVVIINPDSLSGNRISMKGSANTLDETVVIGYGTQKKRDITGAITSITAKDLDNSVGGSIESSLQGKIPGLNITQNSGEPGTSSTITLRGASSLNGSSEPLYIIDGVTMDSESIPSIQGDASFNPLAGINLSDIESIEVLRDAASAAIYGSRAANGVIIITTKGGSENQKVQKPTVRLSHNSSISVISHYLDVMNSHDFRSVYKDARANAGLEVTEEWALNPSHPEYANSTNWQALLFRPTYNSKTDLSVNGATDKTSYGISFGYLNNDPILLGTRYRQFSGRGNFGYKISNRIWGSTNVNFSKTDYTRVMSGQTNMSSAIRSVISAPPVFSPYDFETGELTNLLSNASRNPMAIVTKYPLTYNQKMVIASQSFRVTLAKWLDYRVKASLQERILEQKSYFPKEYDSNNVDTSRYSDTHLSNYSIDNSLTFHNKWGSHALDALLGQTYQYDKRYVQNMVSREFMDESMVVVQNANVWSTMQQLTEESALLSFLGRINYNYKSRYIAQVTLRADGSSRFGSNRRYGFFPSASFGWRFSDERFMLFARNVLTDGKLRLSYGVTGNQKLGNYTWQGLYSTSNSGYGGNVSVVNSILANNDLSWERTAQANAGLDLSLFRGRLVINADAYLKDTDNLLFNTPLASFSGFSARTTNFGSIRNTGFEFAVNSVNVEKKKFQWSTSFNIAMNRNKITSLSSGEDVIYSSGGIYGLCRVGEPVGVFYGWRALGVYASDSDNVYLDKETGIERPVLKGTLSGEAFKGGDMIWDDIDDNGIINDDDRIIIGDPHPAFTGGFGISFVWRNWTLSAYFTYSYGNKVINSQRRIRNKMSQLMNLGTDALARWREQGDETDFPKIVYGDPMDNFRPSTFTIEDGSFIRFKDLSLSYSIPKTLCKKMKIQNLSFSLTASNILLWTNYSGFDPEVNTSDTAVITGLDNGAFPKSRVFGLSANITF